MPPTHTAVHTYSHASRAAPCGAPPPLLRNEVIIEVDAVYAVHTGQPRRGRQKEWRARMEGGTFHFLPSMRKNKKSDSYSNYPATSRDNSKREPSVEEVQCSSLGTKDSSPKQCCCLWPAMKTGWVVESLALGICGIYSNLLFCSTILMNTLDMWPCLSSSIWFLWMSRIQVQAPSRKRSLFLGLTKVFPWSTPNSFIAL